MKNSYDFRSVRDRFLILGFAVMTVLILGTRAGELPFDPVQICRLSVDNIPRSISIRQGAGVWLGYDLEKAVVFKVWQAPDDKSGLVVESFKAQSAGKTLFESKSAGHWQLKGEGNPVGLTPRYLGCTETEKYFELRWELSHPGGSIKLCERIAIAAATGKKRAHRELLAESLPAGAALLLPAAYGKVWVLTGPDGKTTDSLSSGARHHLSLR